MYGDGIALKGVVLSKLLELKLAKLVHTECCQNLFVTSQCMTQISFPAGPFLGKVMISRWNWK